MGSAGCRKNRGTTGKTKETFIVKDRPYSRHRSKRKEKASTLLVLTLLHHVHTSLPQPNILPSFCCSPCSSSVVPVTA
ncbi:hypothetical protein NECAME_10412 [Necator americanus]|uniref:Uncharacterized protein n=1 Tax=Necator americanus TaxID=51031 RepID=W2T920_NECAM|nr:hypothetical protein NECAME_10412 [Necator americanus]ETN78348.1 hypothetical protein NECAME_10412 [Necator americanus]